MNISVALCTYNGEKFLREQLDSIAAQTLPPAELVVCDDRSQDGTLVILEDFKNRAAFPVAIHRNEENLGSTKNFEKAINHCSGEIIVLSDQDDVWKPQKLERLAKALQTHPEAGYAFSDAELVDEQLNPLPHSLWDSVGFRDRIRARFDNGEQVQCFARQHIVTGATMAFRRSIGEMAMPFPTVGNWIHDGWIALVSSATGYPGIPVAEQLISYRQHSSQQIGAPDPLEKEKRKSLLGMYQELKNNQQFLFSAWEKHCLQILKLKDILQQLRENYPSPTLERNLNYFQEFENHFLRRKKILTSQGLGRYGLVIREACTGRYGQFSGSWRSIFRDLFL